MQPLSTFRPPAPSSSLSPARRGPDRLGLDTLDHDVLVVGHQKQTLRTARESETSPGPFPAHAAPWCGRERQSGRDHMRLTVCSPVCGGSLLPAGRAERQQDARKFLVSFFLFNVHCMMTTIIVDRFLFLLHRTFPSAHPSPLPSQTHPSRFFLRFVTSVTVTVTVIILRYARAPFALVVSDWRLVSV